MADLLAEMVHARMSWVSPRVQSWYSEGRLADQVARSLRTEANRVGDVEFGAGYRDQAGLAVQDPLDWANRRIDLAAGGWVVTGIRFRGLDIARPFVDVIATNEPPTAEGLAAVADAVLPAYKQFKPLALRVEAPDATALVADVDHDARFGGLCGIDMHIVADKVTGLLARDRVPSYHEVALLAGDADRLAGRVAAIYEQFSQVNPALAMWAAPEDADSLADCAGEGLLFEVHADGRAAGVVAAIRDDAHGMSGFSVQELCLDAQHRGRRLAPGVLQHLLERLPAADGDVLWGTIHPENTPSLRNSLSIGRGPVAGYVWITPDGLPGMPHHTREPD